MLSKIVHSKTIVTWGIMTGLMMLHIFLAYISSGFAYSRDMVDKPVILFVSIEIIAGILYLLAVRKVSKIPKSAYFLCAAIIVGLLLRLTMFFSTPVLEDDFYRYLWDGAVTANGVSPYAYSPDDVMYSGDGADEMPPVLSGLAEKSMHILKRINYPHLRTIYPPVAQAAFASAYCVAPFSMSAWRAILLITEAISLVLIMVILRKLSLPLVYLIIYWWNPLIVKEVFNSGHMDALLIPFLLGSFLSVMYKRFTPAAFLLALAFGVKIWPVLLLPLILRPLFKTPVRLIAPVTVFGLTAAVMLLPVYLAGLGDSSGFVRYSLVWEMNDALYMLFLWIFRFFFRSGESAHLMTRGFIVIMLSAWVVFTIRKNVAHDEDFFKRALLVVAALFLLSPTQFPWYYVWILPFLMVYPVLPLLLLTVLLNLYYLRFYFSARGLVTYFDYGIVWIEFVPVWILIFREWLIGKSTATAKARISHTETA